VSLRSNAVGRRSSPRFERECVLLTMLSLRKCHFRLFEYEGNPNLMKETQISRMLSRKYASVFCRLTEQLLAKSVAGTVAKTEFLYHGQNLALQAALACPKVH
jgi:hypothetical protein